MMLLQALGNFAAYFGTAVLGLLVFQGIYLLVTPHKEIALIRQGNAAAAVSYVGAILGFVIPVASVIAHSVSLLDMVVWAVVALVVQVGVFLVLRLVYRTLSADITAGRIAPALKLAGVSVAVGILNAACMTY